MFTDGRYILYSDLVPVSCITARCMLTVSTGGFLIHLCHYYPQVSSGQLFIPSYFGSLDRICILCGGFSVPISAVLFLSYSYKYLYSDNYDHLLCYYLTFTIL